jgi:hypothetical protein
MANADDAWHYHQTCQHGAYRLTCDDYDALWKYARGRCQICEKTAEEVPGRKLFIDHDGRYGFFAVRGILCPQCNTHMSFVDRGAKPGDSRVWDYIHNAWLVRVLHERWDDRPGKASPSLAA